MSALQNTVCRKVRNSISYKSEQPQKGYKEPCMQSISKHIEACKHFTNWNHFFHKHEKFIIIEQINNIKNTSTEVLKQRRKDRENYWIKRVETSAPFGLNQELN